MVKGKSNTIKKQGNVKVANWDNEKDTETELTTVKGFIL